MDFWNKDMLSFFVKYLGTYRKKVILHGCEDSHLLLGLILKDGTSVKLPLSQQYALAVFRRFFQNWELLRYWAWNICFFSTDLLKVVGPPDIDPWPSLSWSSSRLLSLPPPTMEAISAALASRLGSVKSMRKGRGQSHREECISLLENLENIENIFKVS